MPLHEFMRVEQRLIHDIKAHNFSIYTWVLLEFELDTNMVIASICSRLVGGHKYTPI